ncbi:zinc ribbon domain-containing protein, partial [Streptacidiphilus neutrinimicus]|uniref:zinc ribbon domain-containing protein n=1 Tax=Streptacidiphilus neutrinimicus TaxID=105420 RepID=UPI003F70CA91
MSETMDQLTLSCPNCAQPVAESDRYCEECGIDLSAARADAPDPRAASAASPGGFAAEAHGEDYPLGSGLPAAATSPAGGTHGAGPVGDAHTWGAPGAADAAHGCGTAES